MKAPTVDRSLETTAARYAARCIEINDLTQQLSRRGKCEAFVEGPDFEDPISAGPVGDCIDRMKAEHADDEDSFRWYAPPADELAACCPACRAVIKIVCERAALRRTVGALKRSLLAAYRRTARHVDGGEGPR